KNIRPVAESTAIIAAAEAVRRSTWMDLGAQQYTDEKISFTALPSALYGAEWIQTANRSKFATPFKVTGDADVYIAADANTTTRPDWLKGYEDTKTQLSNNAGTTFKVYRKHFLKGESV